MPRSRGTSFGWMVAAAAALLVVGSFEAASSSGFTGTKSALAQSGKRVPPSMLVVVSDESRLFHAPGCKFIHDKAHERTLAAGEAIDEGYAPCARCMKQYLSDVVGMRPLTPDVLFAAGSARAAAVQ